MKENDIFLSICIPTYNRVDYLEELLASLTRQCDIPGVEICISDNASSDGTERFMRGVLKSGNSTVRYIRQSVNIGLDNNMLAVVSMAQGRYIYPLGDDDMLPPGAVDIILAELERSFDLLILNAIHTDAVLKPLRRHLPDELAGRSVFQADEAFSLLWDKMPFGSFIAARSLFEISESNRYAGTSHAYTGVVWDALARKHSNGSGCIVRCMDEHTVLLRGAEKTWRHDAAAIMLKQIPLWFEVVGYNKVYMDISRSVLKKYLDGQTSLVSLAYLRANGQLSLTNAACLASFCNGRQKLNFFLVSIVPVAVLKSLVFLRDKLKLLANKLC